MKKLFALAILTTATLTLPAAAQAADKVAEETVNQSQEFTPKERAEADAFFAKALAPFKKVCAHGGGRYLYQNQAPVFHIDCEFSDGGFVNNAIEILGGDEFKTSTHIQKSEDEAKVEERLLYTLNYSKNIK